MHPDEALERVLNGVYVYQQAADKALARVGVVEDDLSAFFEHVRTDPRRLSDAIQKLTMMRDPSAFKKWAVEWKADSARRASGR